MIVYDAECPACVRGRTSLGQLFESRGFRWLPLQTPGTAARLGVQESALVARMHVLDRDGRVFSGVDAVGVLWRRVWWLWPLGAFLMVPGIRGVGRLIYDFVARNRYCLGGRCRLPTETRHVHNHHGARSFLEMP